MKIKENLDTHIYRGFVITKTLKIKGEHNYNWFISPTNKLYEKQNLESYFKNISNFLAFTLKEARKKIDLLLDPNSINFIKEL